MNPAWELVAFFWQGTKQSQNVLSPTWELQNGGRTHLFFWQTTGQTSVRKSPYHIIAALRRLAHTPGHPTERDWRRRVHIYSLLVDHGHTQGRSVGAESEATSPAAPLLRLRHRLLVLLLLLHFPSGALVPVIFCLGCNCWWLLYGVLYIWASFHSSHLSTRWRCDVEFVD